MEVVALLEPDYVVGTVDCQFIEQEGSEWRCRYKQRAADGRWIWRETVVTRDRGRWVLIDGVVVPDAAR